LLGGDASQRDAHQLTSKRTGRTCSRKLSYTVSRSTREEHFVTALGGGTVLTVAADYDRFHGYAVNQAR
jgi:hypothetical protein